MRTCRRSDFQWKSSAARGFSASSLALGAVLVGVEDETVGAVALQQHHPDARLAVRVRGRERHRLRIVGLARPRLGEPLVEQLERIGPHRALALGLAPRGTATHLVSRGSLRHGSDNGTRPLPTLGPEARRERGGDQEGVSQPRQAASPRPQQGQSERGEALRRRSPHAYDLLSDKDKRARYDRGEIDEDGNPKMPFGGGFGGYSAGARAAARRRAAGVRKFQLRRRRSRPTSATCSKACSAAAARGARRRRPFGGFRQRARAPQKGADVAYRLKVPFDDAVALKPQRITLADGKTIDLKLPQGARGRNQDPARRQGPGGAGRARRRDRHDRDRAAPLLHARGHQHPPRAAGHAQGSGARSEGEGADARGPGDADDPQGHELGQGAAAQGPRLHRQGRQARRPAGHGRDRRAGARRRRSSSSPKSWSGGGNPRAALGV